MATLEAVLAEGRLAAAARMIDTCTVRYRTGDTVQDEDTGEELPVMADRFTSPCRLATGSAPTVLEVGGRQVAIAQPELHLPFDGTSSIVEDDEVVMSADSAPEVATRTFRVVALPAQSQATARRIPLRET